ncbi:site-specific integrase [Sphaerisporangium sp. NPDC049003]|uniref:site-specific integrase n=1 Tax=Sphaerisporangium sp. NPDC049003 TaxID=3364517 RepID=UPI00371C9045
MSLNQSSKGERTVRTRNRVSLIPHPGNRTGVRRGELFGLRWTDADLTSGTLTIRQALQYIPGGIGLILAPTKTVNSERRIALPGPCIDALTTDREHQKHKREAIGAAWPETGLVFTTRHGGMINPANVNRDFKALLQRAGLRTIRFHDLRHSCASLLLDQGVDLIVIKEILGHAHISITADTYAHVRLRLQLDAIERMAGALDDHPQTLPSETITAAVAVQPSNQVGQLMR